MDAWFDDKKKSKIESQKQVYDWLIFLKSKLGTYLSFSLQGP